MGNFTKKNVISNQQVVKLKTSNSVYYANSLSSLYIPELQNPLSSEIRIDIDNMIAKKKFTNEQIVN